VYSTTSNWYKLPTFLYVRVTNCEKSEIKLKLMFTINLPNVTTFYHFCPMLHAIHNATVTEFLVIYEWRVAGEGCIMSVFVTWGPM